MKRLGVVLVTMTLAGGAVLLGVSGGAVATTTTPSITSVVPEHGPVAGGNVVTINGRNLAGTTSVDFGGISVTPTNRTPTRIQVVAPAGNAGSTVDIRATTTFGTSPIVTADQYSYVTGPVIESVRPTIGSTRGDNLVEISGSGFTGATAVDFGAAPSGSFSVLADNTVLARSPAGSLGTVNVTVTVGTASTPTDLADRFTYVLGVPTISAVVFDVGNVAGGATVTIFGTRFSSDATVFFGTTPAASVQYVNADELTAVAPAASTPGTVDVSVTTHKGTSVITAQDQYEYTATGP